MKKSILWLLAVLLVGLLTACGTKQNAPPATVKSEPGVQIYWNVDYYTYQADTGMTRIKNGDYYRAAFAVNGEQVDLFFDNYVMLEYADTMQYMGLIVDENNVVQQVLKIDEFTGGLACLNAYVDRIDGDTVLCNSSLNFRELPIKLKTREDTGIYYMDDDGGPLVGMPTQLQRGSRVTAIQDKEGYAICIYAEPPFEEKPVYHIKGRMYDSATKMSTRESDALGVYTIPFAVDGQLVELKCRDQKLVNQIDSYATMCMHLEFDEEGYISNVAGAWHATGTWSDISWCYVTELHERCFVAQDKSGKSFTGYYAENVKIFNVDSRAESFGEPTQLQIGDRVHCSCNKGKDINVIFVNLRSPVMDIYWNVDRMYHSEAQRTNRAPDKNGWYHITMAVNGEQKQLRTQSYELINKIDAYPAKCCALKLDGDVITDVIDPWSTKNGSTWGSWVNITAIADDGTVTAVKLSGSKVTDTLTGKLDPNYKAYDVTGNGLFEGVETTVRVGDKVHALKNYDGTVGTVFVVNRAVDCELYFNLDRYYDSANKVTTRVPDSEGYYVFTLAVNGKQVQLRTASRDIATQIDKVATKAVGLKVRGDKILKVYAESAVEGYTGGRKAAWYTVTGLEGNKIYTENKNVSDVDYGWTYEATMTATCPVYNCSTAFINYRGEKTGLQVGDRIMCVTNAAGKTAVVYVVSRQDDVPIYWNVDKMWDGTASTRTPDADGWYWFTMALDGRHVKLKTDDKSIADTIDGRVVDCIGLVTDGDRITRTVMPWKAEATIGGDFGSWTYVTELSGDTVRTLKLDSGKVHTGIMDEKTQVFDVSSGAELEGELSDLRLGDLIHGLADKNGNPRIIYIISRTQAHGSNHCTCGGTLDDHAKNMHNEADGSCSSHLWKPVAGTDQWKAFTVAGKLSNSRRFEAREVYIYLSADVTMSNKLEVYPGQTVNICLNGHTLKTASGQRFGEIAGGTLNICDCTGGGKLLSSFSTALYAYADGRINLYGGTVTTSVTTTTQRWGVVYLGNDKVSSLGLTTATKSDMTIYGGCVDASGLSLDKVCGAASGQDSMGGAIWGFASTTSLTIHGGTVKGGSITSKAYGSGSTGTYVKGGAIALTGSSNTFTMTGGRIIGGNVPYGRGGAVYLAGKNNTITGGTISGGSAAYGGSLFSCGNDVTVGGTAVIEGGTASSGGGAVYIFSGTLKLKDQAQIRGGSTTGTVSGGNIFLRWGSNASMIMDGGTVSGGKAGASGTGECGNLYVGYQTTVTLNGGTVTGGRAKNGGNIGSYGTVVMNGGTIEKGAATGYGGNVSLYMDTESNPAAAFTMNGGTISGGSAASGGNVRLGKNCTFTLVDGTVTGGTATADGGNFWVGKSVTKNGVTCCCTLVLQGGAVSGGTATRGGGIFADPTSVIRFEGTTELKENTPDDHYTA